MLLGKSDRLAQLAADLVLAHDQRIEAGGDTDQVQQRVTAAASLKMRRNCRSVERGGAGKGTLESPYRG